MSAPILVPLDDAFVRRLRDNIRDQSHLFSPVARAHWQALFNHFEGRTDFEIRAYIAQNFNTNNWLDSETWFDARTQFLFQGYDRTEFEQANHPALNDQARDHYSPSNTVREHLRHPPGAKPCREGLSPSLAMMISFAASGYVLTL